MLRNLIIPVLVLAMLGGVRLDAQTAAGTDVPDQPAAASRSPLGDAFRSMFNPGAAPRVRTMGSFQRTNFLDDLLNARGRLEVAFVIDGTDSMGAQLVGVQQQLGSLISDLRRIVGKQLAVQMIIYRDVGAPSGAVSWPLSVAKKSWATEDADIAAGLNKLVPESGEPYFYEQVDTGLYTAIHELEWSTDPDVSRWIFLIGDAPPFKAGFREVENQAVRQYDSELLKRAAQDKGIRIYGIICPSRSEDMAIHQQVLPECRQFFDEIATATGGSVLDLADPSQLRKVQVAADEATQRAARFAPITQAELDQFKTASKKPIDRVIVAVLPFLDIKSMDFDTKNPMTQLAEEVRSQLDQKGIQTRSLSKVRDAYLEVRRSRVRVDDSVLPQLLADRLKADYLIWRHQPATNAAFQVAVINARTGKPETVSDPIDAKTASEGASPLNVRLCSQVMQSLANKTKGSPQPIAKVFNEGRFQTRLVSTSEVGTRAVEYARLQLQSALRKSANTGDETDLLAARDELLKVEKEMSSDPLWNNLLANAYFGLALQNKIKNKAIAADYFKQARRYGEAASRANKEFLADHYFLQKRYANAIQTYESIVQESLSPDTICRAHWMLVFLYAGDWEVEESNVNIEKSRQHAIALLANYPDSKEADALREALRWDASQQRTKMQSLVLEEPSPSDVR